MDFSNLKNKLLSTLGQATDSAKDLAGKAGEGAKNLADKAKDMGRVAKLNMEIATEKENMRKSFTEIGRMYYEANKDAPDALFTQLCGEIALAEKNIADKEAEIAVLKGSGEPDVSVEFEEVVAAEEASEGCCCAAEEVKEAAEDTCCCAKEVVEDVKDAAEDACCCAKEVVEDVKDAVEDACDCAKDE
jgi:uncharacterized protein YjbJ (UPF0337 family)